MVVLDEVSCTNNECSLDSDAGSDGLNDPGSSCSCSVLNSILRLALLDPEPELPSQ